MVNSFVPKRVYRADNPRLSTSMQLYRSLLGIQSVNASVRGTSHLLRIVYDVPTPTALGKSTNGRPNELSSTAELILEFDPASKRLIDAQVSLFDLHSVQKLMSFSW